MLKGNDQKIYFNGDLLATLTKAEAKLTMGYEEINLCGQYAKEYELTEYSIEGTITRKKTDSRVLKLYCDALVKGDAPELVITGVNMSTNGQNESVTIQNAKITEIALLNAEAGSVIEEEIPFNASKFTVTSYA